MPEYRTAETKEEAQTLGFFGTAPMHDPRNDTLAGVVVNSDDAPTPDSVSGPGAEQPSKQDELKEDGIISHKRGTA